MARIPRWRGVVAVDPFRELADNYTRLSEEYTAEVLRLRKALEFVRQPEVMAVIEAARWVAYAGEEDEGGEWDLAHKELCRTVEWLDRIIAPSCTEPHLWFEPDKLETFCRVCGDIRKDDPDRRHDLGLCRNRKQDDNGAVLCDCPCDDCERGWHP